MLGIWLPVIRNMKTSEVIQEYGVVIKWKFKSWRLWHKLIDLLIHLNHFWKQSDAWECRQRVVILTWTFSQCFGFLISLNTSFWIIVTIFVFFDHSCFISFVIFCSWSFNRTASCGPWGPTTIIAFLVPARNYKAKKNILKEIYHNSGLFHSELLNKDLKSELEKKKKLKNELICYIMAKLLTK